MQKETVGGLRRIVSATALSVVGLMSSGCGDRPNDPLSPASRSSVVRNSRTGLVLDTWTTMAPMPTARQDAVAGVIGGKLYVAGGYAGGEGNFPPYPKLRVLEAYDPATDSWETKAQLPIGVQGAMAGVINGKLYVAGGFASHTEGNELAILQVYDAATDRWEMKASMPVANGGGSAGVIDGKLYVVGSSDLDNALRVYDPANDTWVQKASMSDAMAFGAAAGVIDGKLYVVGGSGQPCPESSNCAIVGNLRVYDPATDRWDATRDPMPTPRVIHSAGVLNGKLHVVGGALWPCCGIATPTHEAYDPSTDSWSAEPSMPTTRYALVAGVIDGRLYATGGSAPGPFFMNALEVFGPPSTYSTTVGHTFLNPISLPPQAPRVFKIGSTIPVKFQLFLVDGVTPVSTATATILVTRISSTEPDGVPVTVESTVANAGTAFRYDAAAQQYVFNLGTKGWAAGSYRVTALLDDGSEISAIVGAR